MRHHTYLDDLELPYPPFTVRNIISGMLGRSGRDLFGTDHAQLTNSLLYQMATDDQFLQPLRQFKKHRLYVNVHLDLMVPLATGGIFHDNHARVLREKFVDQFGIVHHITPSESCNGGSESSCEIPVELEFPSHSSVHKNNEAQEYLQMISSLNTIPWEKVLVRFPGTVPTAHDKICAITKFSEEIDRWLGFHEGRFVMDHAVDWFCGRADGGKQEVMIDGSSEGAEN